MLTNQIESPSPYRPSVNNGGGFGVSKSMNSKSSNHPVGRTGCNGLIISNTSDLSNKSPQYP